MLIYSPISENKLNDKHINEYECRIKKYMYKMISIIENGNIKKIPRLGYLIEYTKNGKKETDFVDLEEVIETNDVAIFKNVK